MHYNKVKMGGRYHIYPTDIDTWVIDESYFNENTVSLIENNYQDSLFSAKIEKINEADDINLIYNLMNECDESDITHEYLYHCFDVLNKSPRKSESYRSCNVTIAGNFPPYYFDVYALMDKFIVFCNDKSQSIQKRVVLGHLYFEMVHPFIDGNGRIGRLLMYKISKKGYSEYFFNNLDLYYNLLNPEKNGSVQDWVDFVSRFK